MVGGGVQHGRDDDRALDKVVAYFELTVPTGLGCPVGRDELVRCCWTSPAMRGVFRCEAGEWRKQQKQGESDPSHGGSSWDGVGPKDRNIVRSPEKLDGNLSLASRLAVLKWESARVEEQIPRALNSPR